MTTEETEQLIVSSRDFERICDAIENPPPPTPYFEEIAAFYQAAIQQPKPKQDSHDFQDGHESCES